MKARQPDRSASIDRDGFEIAYDVYNEHGTPTVVLLPSWQVASIEHWKAQVPVLARHHRVVTVHGRGTGRSSRPVDAAAYADRELVADIVGVLDELGIERAVVAGTSWGGTLAAQLAAAHPDRVLGLVMIAAGGAESPRPLPYQPDLDESTYDPQGLELYALDAWRHHFHRFAQQFWELVFVEPHSTKQIEDGVEWTLDTGGAVLTATTQRESVAYEPGAMAAVLGRVTAPTLLIQGTLDLITPMTPSVAAAESIGADVLLIEGGGHVPGARDPIRVNRALLDFVDRVTPPAERAPRRATWTRALARPKRVLFLSSPIGLGHARRDLAIARELRAAHEDLRIDWLTQHPVTAFLESAGEHVHPAATELASETVHFENETHEHALHAFQAVRRMDEILVNNFSVVQDLVDTGDYDLVVGDEAWDVDHFWHENPELKKTAFVWMTDFVGWLPMPEGGDGEAALTADYNAEMLEHVERFARVRDRSVFIGDADDIVPDSFGPGLPDIRTWTEQHYGFAGYITGFDPPDDAERVALRASLGYPSDVPLVVVAVGGTRTGVPLLRKVAAAHAYAGKAVDDLQMLIVCGPRIDPAEIPTRDGIDVRGYVPDLHLHLAACDAAIVQGGLTTTMELVAARRPFLYFPLANHFEQQRHVRHRLDRYGAGRAMSYADSDTEEIADALVGALSADVGYLPVPGDGAARAAALIAEVL